ncbi:hypothetical protein [Bradyrhizobium sp. HKCCYLR20261]|uniref:hypothetical protein n=1 Tax=Bradyrhizobium sp. HKCCYLR20261 TaxID=3420760 RepID=UPI003EC13E62
MPTPADIINVISTRFAFPRKSVAQHDRLLVVNGQRRISGRGRSATAQPSDAAALLVAVAATPIAGPAISISSYQSYANLRAVHLPPGRFSSWKQIESLRELADGHTLVESLSLIIGRLAKGLLLPENGEGMLPQGAYPYHIDINVVLHAPMARASVRIERTPENSSEPDLSESLHYYPAAEDKKITRSDNQIDFAQERSFGMLTLWSLAKLFA